MAKKKPSKKIAATETVHFRPGQWLGQMIASHADTWNLSRGAAAKRLAGLAACGLTDTAFSDVDELRQLSAGTFEGALQHVYVEIVEHEREGKNLDGEERHGVVRQVLQRYRLMHGMTEEEETEERQQVRVRRNQK